MKKLKYLLAAIAWISVTSDLLSQSKETADTAELYIINLVSGSTIEAEINEWVYDEYLDIKTTWTENLILPAEAIKSVIQKSTLKAKYNFKDRGSYYSAKMQLITGNDGQRARHINGAGVSFSYGKRWSRLLGLGVGVGYDKYVWDTGENLVPLFLEFTSYFNPSATSIFFNLQAGYSLAFKDNDYLIIAAKGGRMIYPAIGLRMGKGKVNYTLDFGYKFQKASFTYGNNWGIETSEQRLHYKRLSLRFGILI